jgi:hypothetical protein
VYGAALRLTIMPNNAQKVMPNNSQSDRFWKLVCAIFGDIFCDPLIRLNAEFFNRKVHRLAQIGLVAETFRPDGVPAAKGGEEDLLFWQLEGRVGSGRC